MDDLWTAYFDNQPDIVLQTASQRLRGSSIAETLHITGLTLLGEGHAEDGLACLRVACMITKDHPHWYANAATVALSREDAVSARHFTEVGLRHHPDNHGLHFARGNALMALGEFSSAAQAFVRALQGDPVNTDYRLNLGNSLRFGGQGPDALPHYDAVLAQAPGHHAATVNRISLLADLGRTVEAQAALATLPIDVMAQYPEMRFMAALMALGDGDYARGWPLYRARWACDFSAEDCARFDKPLAASLADLKRQHVLVIHEQGFGDSLQFVRFVPLLARHADRVTVLVPANLRRLFQHTLPGIAVLDHRDDVDHHTVEVPMLDMPFLLGTTLESIPDTIPYLVVPPEQPRPALIATGRKRVGLVWAGEQRPNPQCIAIDRRRSMALSTMQPILSAADVAWVSLQMGHAAQQSEACGVSMQTPLRPGFDWLDTAAVVQQLDLVITVDTAIAHLAAGLGVPTWVLSRHDGCWRWLLNRDDSPWYPGVLRLFRQRTPGDWRETVGQVAAALADTAG